MTDTPGVDPDSPPEVAAEGASVTGATIAIPLLQLDVNTLFIPSEPPAGWPARCAGAQPAAAQPARSRPRPAARCLPYLPAGGPGATVRKRQERSPATVPALHPLLSCRPALLPTHPTAVAGVTAACAAPGATCFTNCPGISGQQPPMSRAAVRGKIFAELNAGATVGAYFNKCRWAPVGVCGVRCVVRLGRRCSVW